MRANTAETVYPAEWPAFPGETEARRAAQADLRVVDDNFCQPPSPDWLTMTDIFREEETAAFEEADASGIYDYEIETQRPLPRLEAAHKQASLRQRVKDIMGQASGMAREASISTMATLQAKTESVRNKRGKIAAVAIGALVLGGLSYMEYKGISASAPVREVGQAHHNAGETLSHHHEHIHRIARLALHSGDNPWTVTENQLHAHGVAHPSEARIAADDARLLKLNHISTLQAMKLHVGDKLKLLKVW